MCTILSGGLSDSKPGLGNSSSPFDKSPIVSDEKTAAADPEATREAATAAATSDDVTADSADVGKAAAERVAEARLAEDMVGTPG